MYVSYTHFRVNNPIGWLLFQIHAFRSGNQVSCSIGLIKWTTWPATYRDFCIISTWNSRRDMIAFTTTGTHLKAMKLSKYMGKGYTVGWEADDPKQLPDLMALRADGAERLKAKLDARQLGHRLPA